MLDKVTGSLIEKYYYLRPFIPRSIQLSLRRAILNRKKTFYKNIWPIDEKAGTIPDGWGGWPDNKKFALVLTHDIETREGHDKCDRLMKLEQELGFRSSFNFVPEKYNVSSELRHRLTNNGFEVGVHDLYHDGKLYKSPEIFKERAVRINQYLKDWDCSGFRSGSMFRNLDWIHRLDIEYDASTFDTDPFEPQSIGEKTIFPFIVSDNANGNSYVELPYTLPQDFTLFVLMKEQTIDIWKKKLDWIAKCGGMALVITHPDYMDFEGGHTTSNHYPAKFISEFLAYVKEKYEGQYWHGLPKELSRFWANTYNKPRSNQDITTTFSLPVDEYSGMVKPRVLMIVENAYPGDSRVRKEATALKESFDITVISLKRNYKKWHETVDGVEVFRIPEVVISMNGIQNRFMKLFLSLLNYVFQYAFFTSLSAGLFLLTHIKRRYKVIHAHNPPDTLFIIGLIGKLFSIKFVYDHHDLAPELYLSRFTGRKDIAHKILLMCEKLSCKIADVVIATNNSYKDIEVNRHGILPDKIHVVRNNPIINEFSVSKGDDSGVSQENNKKKNILYLGSINPQDGVEVLIDALRYLVNDLGEQEILCRFVGDGDSLEGIKAKVNEFDLMDYCEFTGYVYDRDKIKKYLAESDVCVEPAPDNALNRHSTFIKIMEYMAAAKPIVAFDLIETRYSANGFALLVPPGNIQAFAHAIKKLFDNPELTQKLSREGFQRVSSDLTWEKAARNLADAYKSLF